MICAPPPFLTGLDLGLLPESPRCPSWITLTGTAVSFTLKRAIEGMSPYEGTAERTLSVHTANPPRVTRPGAP
jgi:hypothetical protein